jgi:ectoine hydroxylase-related dioxygenase (phytanoyl-CoA dioxygenase family)
MSHSVLSDKQITEFKEHGVLVVDNVLNDMEIAEAREGLYLSLTHREINIHDESTIPNLAKLSSTHGSGGVLDIFYDDWKLKLFEHEKILQIVQALWRETFALCQGDYCHPYGQFDSSKAYGYIDRICFRLPDHLAQKYGSNKKRPLQRGLAPHLDCCPHTLYTNSDQVSKWKPIQAFISLTDSPMKDSGGFECCPGLHRNFKVWAENREWTKPKSGSGQETHPVCVGEYTPIRVVEDADILNNFCHIPVKRGSLVLWDNRLPHANARFNSTDVVREVVYVGNLTYHVS